MSYLFYQAIFLMAALACLSFVALHMGMFSPDSLQWGDAQAVAGGGKMATLRRPCSTCGDLAAPKAPPVQAEQQHHDNASFDKSMMILGVETEVEVATESPIRSSSLAASVGALKQHPLFKLDKSSKLPLEDVLLRISDNAHCRALNIPIFITMASVKSHLYWQLIENFIYTMTKYDIVACSLMICVSDARCVELCAHSAFPCYNYQYSESFPDRDMTQVSPMEQIATLKLFHFPKALLKGVDVFVVDLDVGFLDNPMKLITTVTGFYKGNASASGGDDFSRLSTMPDVFVQRDTTFIMNRTVEGWRTWWTEPMPNIGLMLIRGNKKTARMFEHAWRMYVSIEKDSIKMNPGKDQNKVVLAMTGARWGLGLNWRYFPGGSAVLIDKIYKFENKSIELGGEHTRRMLARKGTIAVHVTCYEQLSKLMGLKAANAFWNPTYYDGRKRTLTKQLLFSSRAELQSELRSLAYLALATGRSLVLPNLLGPLRHAREGLVDEVHGRALWPGFRVAHIRDQRDIGVEVLEPAFYWRLQPQDVPLPTVVLLHRSASLRQVEDALLAESVSSSLRVVLGRRRSSEESVDSRRGRAVEDSAEEQRLQQWSVEYSGFAYGSYEQELERYYELAPLRWSGGRWDVGRGEARQGHAQLVTDSVRPCASIFERQRGNRSCFDKCK